MPTRSSDIGTEQENKTEVVASTRKPKSKAAVKKEKLELPTTEEVVDGTPAAEATEEAPNQSPPANQLSEYDEFRQDKREQIDSIDDQILELVARRIEVASELLKSKHGLRMNLRDKLREQEIFTRQIDAAKALGSDIQLNHHQIRELYALLIRFGVESFRRNIIDRR